MKIIILNKPDKDIAKQISEVENLCKAHDKTKGNISLDQSLNFYPEMKSLFLLYEHDKLISLLSIFMPKANEAEISAYTLPGYRRKGYFKILLNKSIEELKKYGLIDILFVCETLSNDGRETMQKLDTKLCFTEYFLAHRGRLKDFNNKHITGIEIQKADFKHLDTIAALYQQIFGDDYKDAKSMIIKSLDADNRDQYIALFDNKPIGTAAVSFDGDGASIFGLGISPQYQGKGYGKELLNLILKELELKGIKKIFIEVDSFNKSALNLYLKSGFEIEFSYDYYRKNIENFL